jgi:hypothetical protein
MVQFECLTHSLSFYSHRDFGSVVRGFLNPATVSTALTYLTQHQFGRLVQAKGAKYKAWGNTPGPMDSLTF